MRRGGVLVGFLAGLSLGPNLLAQGGAPPDSATIVPGRQYRAGGFKRTLLGSDYRMLWTTPIRVPILDLSRFAGGLTPFETGGGLQTRSLHLKNPAGREYHFRSVDKDGAGVLPEKLRETFVAGLVRDQTSSGHPAAGLVAEPLLRAVGILHAPASLVVMPDDPRLGEFREEFAGMLGTIEERPDSGFAGAREVLDSKELFERLIHDPENRVDAREFLTARLVDLILGDWDRHEDQWRWALIEHRWRPIPRDRDAALSRYDGWIVRTMAQLQPKLQQYSAEYPSLGGLIRNAYVLDRRLLSELDRAAWDSVAARVRECLTDAVLAEAVNRMPPEFPPEHRAWVLNALKLRRDHVEDAARDFYERLAKDVDLTATDASEEARIEREPGGSTLITVTAGDQVLFRRRFLRGETEEVRLYLKGGDDRVLMESDPGGSHSPHLRVIGGDGDDTYRATTRPASIRLYDAAGNNRVDPGLHVNTKGWRWDADSIFDRAKPLDAGTHQSVLPTLAIAPDVGLVFGGGGWIDWLGFRKVPYASRFEFHAVFATTRGSGRFSIANIRQRENSPFFFRFSGSASGIESLRWYGFGNDSRQEESDPLFYRVRRNEIRGGAQLGIRLGARDELVVGPLIRWSWTPLSDGFNRGQFIATDRPYGTGSFGMAGAGAELRIDRRDFPGFARKGAALLLRVEGYPALLDADQGVARVRSPGIRRLRAGYDPWPPPLPPSHGGRHQGLGQGPLFPRRDAGRDRAAPGLLRRPFRR